jgi:hypothetical protein
VDSWLGLIYLVLVLLSGSTLTVKRGPFVPASGGRMWESSCSAVHERTVPFELV